jgi:hypothetical protein
VPGRGNTLIVPGSHLQNESRIWHSRSANTSDRTRKVIWYGYSVSA